MRRLIGWLLIGLGGVAVLVGVAAAVAFGRDSTVQLGPHKLSVHGSTIVTAPQVVGYAGTTLHLTVSSSTPGAQLFLGAGYDPDVRNYLAGTEYTRIDSVSLPWRVHLSASAGSRRQPANPTSLPWWLVSAADDGTASVTVPLPDAPIDFALLDLTRPRRLTVDVTVAIQQPGAFPGAIAALVGGVGLVTAGWTLSRAGH